MKTDDIQDIFERTEDYSKIKEVTQKEETKEKKEDISKENIPKEKNSKKYFVFLKRLLYAMIVAAAFSVLVAFLVLPIFRIYGTSMEPTVGKGDVVIAVNAKSLKRGDLVGFYHGNKLLVKRCIALPGETITIDESGNVYINGKLIDEPYIVKKELGECDIEFPFQVPENKYFFLGDNREESLDSRLSNVGCIGKDEIKGKVIFRVWPIKKFGIIK